VCIVPLILTIGIRVDWSASHSVRFIPGERAPLTIEYKAGWTPTAGLEALEETVRNRTKIAQLSSLQSSHYTDCVILSPKEIDQLLIPFCVVYLRTAFQCRYPQV
jgi:hypothetical protein